MRKILLWSLATSLLFAQKHELGLTLGGLIPQERLSGGVALQANYGYRFWKSERVALLGEVHFLANGQRLVKSTNQAATRDVATAYVTPGIRVKFAPDAKVSPYLAAGGGYALYEQSYFRIDGRSNEASRFLHRGAFDFGGGVDVALPASVPLAKYLGLRGEVRDFYTGSPAYNLSSLGGGQHNMVAGGGLVIRWGR